MIDGGRVLLRVMHLIDRVQVLALLPTYWSGRFTRATRSRAPATGELSVRRLATTIVVGSTGALGVAVERSAPAAKRGLRPLPPCPAFEGANAPRDAGGRLEGWAQPEQSPERQDRERRKPKRTSGSVLPNCHGRAFWLALGWIPLVMGRC